MIRAKKMTDKVELETFLGSHSTFVIIYMGVALLRRPLLTVSGSLYCFILDKFSYLITFR